MKRADPGNHPSLVAQASRESPRKTERKAAGKAPRRSKADGSVASPSSSVESSSPDAPAAPEFDLAAAELNPVVFRRRLAAWYRRHARPLPWRVTSEPYRIWVSEVMLQQTRVAAVVDHYNEFIRRFPSLVSLALAPEPDVLAAWSGLGYYRRARMLHKAAQFILTEREGRLPATAGELRTLPGIGEYTAAAIASIAFGESIAVVDGNVERVLLRVVGRAADAAASSSAKARASIRALAQTLLPASRAPASNSLASNPPQPRFSGVWNASERLAIAVGAHPTSPVGEDDDEGSDPQPRAAANPAGDHNQAMMELGATICLPRAPLCLQCPVYVLCRTRGEHPTAPRAPQLSRPAAFLLDLRKRGTATEVLLERRPDDASLMPSMYELPPLPLDAVEGREPVLRVRHAITSTNYYVQVFAPRRSGLSRAESSGAESAEPNGSAGRARSEAQMLRRAIPPEARDLHWTRTSRLGTLPLTGLARKILQRLKVMDNPQLNLLE